jgi:hypothetical protein
VGLSPSNHGTALPAVTGGDCNPSSHQQATGSRFLEALDTGAETPAGAESGADHRRRAVAEAPRRRSARPTPPTTSPSAARPVGYAIVADALTHDVPAVRSRTPLTTCLQPFRPGVDPATSATDHAACLGYAGDDTHNTADVAEEPPLAQHAYAR